MSRDEQAMRQRIEARLAQPTYRPAQRPAFDASVRQADAIGATGSRPALLFYRMDLTDKYPVATLIVGLTLVYGLCWVLHAWGLL